MNLLDDEGRVQTQLKGPARNGRRPGGRQPGRFAAGSDLDVTRRNGSSRCTTRIRANRRRPLPRTSVTPGPLLSARTARASPPPAKMALTRLWDTSTGTMTAQCRGHTRKVLSVAFRPDGRRLVTTSADGTVRQWDSATGREVESPYDRHIGEVVTAAYSPDGLWIASGGTDRTIRVWEAANRHDVAVLHGHTGVRQPIWRSPPTAAGLASASQSGRPAYTGDGTVRLWEVRPAGGRVRAARPHQLHLSGGVQPGRTMDRLGKLGQDRALVGRSDRGELRDPAPSGVCARAGLQPGQLVVGLRMSSGRIVADLERRDRPAPEKVQGARKRCYSGHRGEPGRSPHRGCGRRRKREDHGSRDRRGSPLLSDGRGIGAKKSLAYSPDGRLLAGTGEDGTQIDHLGHANAPSIGPVDGSYGLGLLRRVQRRWAPAGLRQR